jgi:hypothetical protein
MFHKFSLAAATAVVLGTAALAPTSASAWWLGEHHWHGGWWGHGPGFWHGGECRRWVMTPWGPRLRWVC